jgi:hypothetical protein
MIVEFPECAADNGPFSGPKHLYAIEIGTDADANDSLRPNHERVVEVGNFQCWCHCRA